MNDPVRWLADREVAQSVRDVLAAADPVPRMPDAVHTNLAAHCATLMAQGVATHTVTGSAWAKLVSSSIASNTLKGIVFASMMGTAGTAGYYVFREPAGSQSRAPVGAHQVHAPAAQVLAMPLAAPVDTDSNAAADEEPAPIAASDAPRLFAPRKTKEADKPETLVAAEPTPQVNANPSVAAFDDPTIADEAKLLESARAALVTNPALALELVQRHEHLHPNGQLYAEREFIAVEALLRLGRRQEAWNRAAPRLQLAPDSLYSKRLRKLFGSDGP